MSSQLTLTLRNELSEIRRLVAALEDFADSEAIPPAAAMRVTLVLDELLTNTITYGYPDGRDAEIEVAARCTQGEVEIAVSDDAAPFDPRRTAEPDLEAALDERQVGGLGIHLINTMADLTYSREGERNVVTLRLPLSEAAATASVARPG